MIISDFPVVKQSSHYDCGEACVTALLRYWGFWDFRRATRDGLNVTEIDGTDPRSIEAHLRRTGFRVCAGNFDDGLLRASLRSGRPVIAAIKDHWVVVTGYRYRMVYLMDPLKGACQKSWPEFLTEWADVDRLGASVVCWGISAWVEDNGT